jgi:hypothetical protein
MPRKRKGPPQESIDSILLAISRRETLDSDTLSHYFDRLDEEWTEGAREKVLHLLRTNDVAAHAAAILILSELATDFDLEELEDFITDPTVSDIAKLTLSPILKELGSDLAEEGMIDYLNDPAAAMQQMQMRMLDLVSQSEMGVEAILVDVVSMPTERRLSFINWLGNSHDVRAAKLLIPLLENQPTQVVTAAIDSLERLGPIALQQTLPALQHLVASTSNRTLKQHARAALGRLTMLSQPGAADTALAEARTQQLPPYEARVSFIDGSGAQLLMLSWQRPDRLLKGVNILLQDRWGIKDCYGVDEIDTKHWNKLVMDMDKQSIGGFKIPFEYAHAFVAEARALNKRTRHKLPIAYSIWRPLIEGDEASDEASNKQAIPSISTLLDVPPLDAEVLAQAQRGDELYRLPQFMSWLYEPLAHIEPYMNRYWATQDFPTLPILHAREPKAAARRHKPKENEKRSALLEELINEALDTLIDEKWRLLYGTRLRRQAMLCKLAGREREARLIVAVAAVLQPGSPVPVREQPFLRALMRLSIEQGPIRKMAEALESDELGSLLGLFEEE